jgi:hypothetical protein
LVTSCFNQRNDVNSENVNSENECEEVQENLRNKIESENQKEMHEEAKMKTVPVQQVPVQQTPLQQTPVQQTPVQQTPPLQQMPLQQTPLQQTPLQQTPLQQTPLQQTPLPLPQMLPHDFKNRMWEHYQKQLLQYHQKPSLRAQQHVNQLPPSSPLRLRVTVEVVKPYVQQQSDELSLNVGETIGILYVDFQNGRHYAVNGYGDEGWYPGIHTALMANASMPYASPIQSPNATPLISGLNRSPYSGTRYSSVAQVLVYDEPQMYGGENDILDVLNDHLRIMSPTLW